MRKKNRKATQDVSGLERKALKELAYEDAKKHARDSWPIFRSPSLRDKSKVKIYDNAYYTVFKSGKYRYTEILDKDGYGIDWYSETGEHSL